MTRTCNIAVVDEEPVARTAVAGEPLEGGGGALDGAEHVVDGDGELVTLVEHDLLVIDETAQTDLGPLEVHQDGDGTTGGRSGLADTGDDHLLILGTGRGNG